MVFHISTHATRTALYLHHRGPQPGVGPRVEGRRLAEELGDPDGANFLLSGAAHFLQLQDDQTLTHHAEQIGLDRIHHVLPRGSRNSKSVLCTSYYSRQTYLEAGAAVLDGVHGDEDEEMLDELGRFRRG